MQEEIMSEQTSQAAVAERWSNLPTDVREEIDVFEAELRRFQSGQVPEKVFTEFRLRNGVYGQRQNGVQMLRIKIPMGRLSTLQMQVLADLSEEYADGISHITTRQDVQYHYVDINDTPDIFRRLAEVGITTKEACGNVVRNVTACPQSGCCSDETFDVTAYAEGMFHFMLRHPDSQNFGRKFKIAFSGCEGHACGLALMHDLGAIAKVREVNGKKEKGFKVYLGGGLGAIPHQAKLYSEFVPADELLPLTQAVSRVFARLGEKKNRAKARMKFLIAKLGVDEFIKLVHEEREKMLPDPRWRQYQAEAEKFQEQPLKPGSQLDMSGADDEFKQWHATNVQPQAQPGYSMVTVSLPLGDIAAWQLRALAALCRRNVGDAVRATVDQNLLVRWVPNGNLREFHTELKRLDLADPTGNGLGHVTSCPGTDSCKLGIASSRGLAATLHEKFHNGMSDYATRQDLKIKISGCFNACGQHHIADIGFFGSSRRVGSHVAPIFQIVLGGSANNNAQSFGLSVGKASAKDVPEVVKTLTDLYTNERKPGESFADYMQRVGKAHIKKSVDHFDKLPDYTEKPEYYRDNRQPWDYFMETGVGECAGEVVSQAEFMLEDADRHLFDAGLQLEAGKLEEAATTAFTAMRAAADGLLSTHGLLLSDRYDTLGEFRGKIADPGDFLPMCAEYFFRAAEDGHQGLNAEQAHQRVEEATLFVEEAHGRYARMGGALA
jgi:sulfite reductase (ferredoxin)